MTLSTTTLASIRLLGIHKHCSLFTLRPIVFDSVDRFLISNCDMDFLLLFVQENNFFQTLVSFIDQNLQKKTNLEIGKVTDTEPNLPIKNLKFSLLLFKAVECC